MADAFGSDSKPVVLDPFATIVEVGWPSKRYLVFHLSIGSNFSAITPCVDPLPGYPPSTWVPTYITNVFIVSGSNNGVRSLGGEGPAIVGVVSGIPGSGGGLIDSMALGEWEYVAHPAQIPFRECGGTTFSIGIQAPLGGEQQCYYFPLGGLFCEALGYAEAARFNVDYSKVIFTDDDGNIWKPVKFDTAPDQAGKLYFSK